jgi:hypothetical protein
MNLFRAYNDISATFSVVVTGHIYRSDGSAYKVFIFITNSITGIFKFNIVDIVRRPNHSPLNSILFEEKSKI